MENQNTTPGSSYKKTIEDLLDAAYLMSDEADDGGPEPSSATQMSLSEPSEYGFTPDLVP